MAAKDFSRDLGYLDKFLSALRAQAVALGGTSGSRLATLMDEQERAWTEIRAILGGSPASASDASEGAAAGMPTTPETPAIGLDTPPAASAKTLTVGSLIAK